MKKAIIKVENLTIETCNFTVNDTDIVVVVGDERSLAYWFRVSKGWNYNIERTSKDVLNIHIPLEDIISIQYVQD